MDEWLKWCNEQESAAVKAVADMYPGNPDLQREAGKRSPSASDALLSLRVEYREDMTGAPYDKYWAAYHALMGTLVG